MRQGGRADGAAGEVSALKGARFSWTSPEIGAHYGLGPGKIAIHLALEGAIRDASGAVTGIRNLGGAGAVFDATRTGPASPLSDGMLDFRGEAATHFATALPADLNDVTLMSAFRLADFAVASRWLGANGLEFRSNPSAQGWFIQIWSNLGGGGGAGNIIGSRLPNIDQVVIAEHAFAAGRVVTRVNGVQIGSSPIPSSVPQPGPLPLQFVGKGSGSNGFRGLIGDVLGITHGPNLAGVEAVARRTLAAKFGVAL
ncbi:hypothetical protein [Paracoccus aminophilus]|uniref:Uncharacterized protein n=1 Tax=Paracoccus aminophilus JCM 7686 TaxID=1367847 RepID=S5XQ02_PARAH|nr:hypothetical protein [Paracoccus aminophilus]AGT09454.1 hypothetical protein JCM7686_2384 [Paracoccus aminophilus JCM 7686]